ncbi:hypothetical protein JCM3770_006384 [Rhodotorula araucariae]
MASLKSLMAAKKQQARITAPFARYSGPRQDQLSCSLCALPVKHESLWSAHVQSKTHRVNVQRHEQEQDIKKRKRTDEQTPSTSKRPRADDDGDDGQDDRTGALPADFFADPAHAPTPRVPSPAPAPAPVPAEADPDMDEFLASLSAANPAADDGGASTARATISAAPVRFEFGAPVVAAEGEDEGEGAAAGEDGADDEDQEETEEERAEREAREEREEMMARLEEEEREQREADEKVTVLKRRLEALRAARNSKKKAV